MGTGSNHSVDPLAVQQLVPYQLDILIIVLSVALYLYLLQCICIYSSNLASSSDSLTTLLDIPWSLLGYLHGCQLQ